MRITNDKKERQEQKEILRKAFSEYDARHHDAFVLRYVADVEKAALRQYDINRHLIEPCGDCDPCASLSPPEHKYENRRNEQRNIAILGGDPTL